MKDVANKGKIAQTPNGDHHKSNISANYHYYAQKKIKNQSISWLAVSNLVLTSVKLYYISDFVK